MRKLRYIVAMKEKRKHSRKKDLSNIGWGGGTSPSDKLIAGCGKGREDLQLLVGFGGLTIMWVNGAIYHMIGHWMRSKWGRARGCICHVRKKI